MTNPVSSRAGRVIVSMLSKQTLPNYLVIRELFQKGDSLLFITSRTMSSRLKLIEQALADLEAKVDSVVFSDDDIEEKWNLMCQEIGSKLAKDGSYLVNLTGGTKFISLAAHKVFGEYNSQFYYLPWPKNYLLRPMQSNDDKMILQYRIKVEEYFKTHGLNIVRSESRLLLPKEYTTNFFGFFVNHLGRDAEIIDKLRSYRDKKHLIISEVENGGTTNYPQIKELSSFLEKIRFPLLASGVLDRAETQYLTGGWFEEYAYSLVKDRLNPDDILLDVVFKTENRQQNELDVVFTLNNKLYVIECKSGGVDKESLANPIIFKAVALKETLFGLAAKSIIFSLSSHVPKRAEDLNALFFDRSYFVDPNKIDCIKNEIL